MRKTFHRLGYDFFFSKFFERAFFTALFLAYATLSEGVELEKALEVIRSRLGTSEVNNEHSPLESKRLKTKSGVVYYTVFDKLKRESVVFIEQGNLDEKTQEIILAKEFMDRSSERVTINSSLSQILPDSSLHRAELPKMFSPSWFRYWVKATVEKPTPEEWVLGIGNSLAHMTVVTSMLLIESVVSGSNKLEAAPLLIAGGFAGLVGVLYGTYSNWIYRGNWQELKAAADPTKDLSAKGRVKSFLSGLKGIFPKILRNAPMILKQSVVSAAFAASMYIWRAGQTGAAELSSFAGMSFLISHIILRNYAKSYWQEVPKIRQESEINTAEVKFKIPFLNVDASIPKFKIEYQLWYLIPYTASFLDIFMAPYAKSVLEQTGIESQELIGAASKLGLLAIIPIALKVTPAYLSSLIKKQKALLESPDFAELDPSEQAHAIKSHQQVKKYQEMYLHRWENSSSAKAFAAVGNFAKSCVSIFK